MFRQQLHTPKTFAETRSSERSPNVRMARRRSMEHRMNVRVPVRLPVSVSYPCKGDSPRVVDTMTRNLSFDGAHIEHGAVDLERGRLIRLELAVCPHGPITLEALVLRCDADGIGLMFAHYGDAVFEGVAALLEPELDKRFSPDRHC